MLTGVFAPLGVSSRSPLQARRPQSMNMCAPPVQGKPCAPRPAVRQQRAGTTSRLSAPQAAPRAGAVRQAQPAGARSAAVPPSQLLASAAALCCSTAQVAAFARCVAAVADPPSRRPALAAALAPVALFGSGAGALLNNPTFCAAAWAWVLAQTLKVFTKYLKTKAWDVRVLFDSGGMPSSHTALVVGLSTSVAVQHGLGSSLFVVCLAFALIVMYDAAGVRRHAGKQAEVLNALVEDYFQGHPVSEQELKEVLGHTPLQVAMGALLGVVVALLYHAKCG